MSDCGFQPNWASPPGHTIQAVVLAKGIALADLSNSLELKQSQIPELFNGSIPITTPLATRLSHAVGSTPRFWLEREKKYQESIRVNSSKKPVLESWFNSFPTKVMYERGWIKKQRDKARGASELLDYFGVTTIEEWKESYFARLGRTKFRTSTAFENSVAATTAWIRHGEIRAASVACGRWNGTGFKEALPRFKALTLLKDPLDFIPRLQGECARFGVALVVARPIPGCAASGATCALDNGSRLLLLSARFLSDDQFWFSFFHEAGHLILHDEPCVEERESVTPRLEAEANLFAQKIILSPESEGSLEALRKNKFGIARFAKRCGVSPGIIVGQLQFRKRIPQSSYNALKVHYKHSDFILGTE